MDNGYLEGKELIDGRQTQNSYEIDASWTEGRHQIFRRQTIDILKTDTEYLEDRWLTGGRQQTLSRNKSIGDPSMADGYRITIGQMQSQTQDSQRVYKYIDTGELQERLRWNIDTGCIQDIFQKCGRWIIDKGYRENRQQLKEDNRRNKDLVWVENE